MSTSLPAEVPEDFRPVVLELPEAVDQMPGYSGGARFVGFYWDATLGPTWDDGEAMPADRSAWWPFVMMTVRVGEFYGVNLGSSGSDATHLLLVDREREEAYIAPRAAAVEFLRAKRRPSATA